MKVLFPILLAAAALLVLPACDDKEPLGDKIEEGVNDALDRRPGEKVRDAAEDAADAVGDAAKEVKDAVKDATN